MKSYLAFLITLTVYWCPLAADSATPAAPFNLLSPILEVAGPAVVPQGHFSSSSVLECEGDWGIPEEQVFLQALTSRRADGREYEIRIGKGSQIYSIRTPSGEFIAPQKPHSAEWVDEVLQTVAVNSDLNDRTHTSLFKIVDGRRVRVLQKPDAYFIHQAGTYNRDVDHPGTFYSPMFARESWAEGTAFSTFVWPQQAHIPNNHRSEIMVYQTVRWVEPGVFEVTNRMHNFGKLVIDWTNLPWIGLAKVRLPYKYRIAADGAWVELDHTWGAGRDIGEFPIRGTGGAAVFSSGKAVEDENIALIFGNQDETADPFLNQRKQHKAMTFLKIGSTANRGDLDLQIATVICQIPIKRDQSLILRYFVALGDRNDINAAVKKYAPLAFRKLMDTPSFETLKSPVRRVSVQTGEDGRQIAHAIADGGWELRPVPFRGSAPLFLIADHKNRNYRMATDPYAVNHIQYCGRTEYISVLGYVDVTRIPGGAITIDDYDLPADFAPTHQF